LSFQLSCHPRVLLSFPTRRSSDLAADAIVSFVGVPNLTDGDFTELKKPIPKFIAETRSPEKCIKPFQKGVLQVAIISRFVFPAPGPKNPHTPREWFDQYFQIVTSASLPPLDASSKI